MTIDKKNHPQVILQEYKYRIKKTQIPKFIKGELNSDLDLDSEVESKSDAKLMAKLEKAGPDSHSEKN